MTTLHLIKFTYDGVWCWLIGSAVACCLSSEGFWVLCCLNELLCDLLPFHYYSKVGGCQSSLSLFVQFVIGSLCLCLNLNLPGFLQVEAVIAL